MVELIIYIIVSYSITTIISESNLFFDLVEKTNGIIYELLRCPVCLGAWVGFILGAINFTPIYFDYYILNIFLSGMLSSGSIKIIISILEK